MLLDCDQIAAIEFVQGKSYGIAPTSRLQITINLHPDRLTIHGDALLKVIARDKAFKSQFETGTSNGGLSAYPGGNRWQWESLAFGGAYDKCSNSRRPKYGALNYKGSPFGASPRFGSSHFRLNPGMIERTTFCFPDSVFKPVDFCDSKHVGRLVDLAETSELDVLDLYIEAHIHGSIDLGSDVDSLVLDPSYQGTSVERQSRKLPVNVEWHSGFELDIQVIRENLNYRGGNCETLADKLAINGILNPRILGEASTCSKYDPDDIKKLWHYVARFGCGEQN